MTIRYNRIFAFVLLGLGAINAVLGGWLFLLGEFSPSVITAVIILLVGFLYLTRPYFMIEPHQVVIPALLGPLSKTYDFASDADLKLENGRLSVRSGTEWKRIRVYRWLSNGDDWRSLEARLTVIARST